MNVDGLGSFRRYQRYEEEMTIKGVSGILRNKTKEREREREREGGRDSPNWSRISPNVQVTAKLQRHREDLQRTKLKMKQLQVMETKQEYQCLHPIAETNFAASGPGKLTAY